MIEDYYSMNDTLDDFTFQYNNMKSQNKIKNCTGSKEINFDDSSFLANFSFDFEENTFSRGDNNSLCYIEERNKNISYKNSTSDQESSEVDKGTNNLNYINIDVEDLGKYNASSSFKESVQKYISPKFKNEGISICKENRKNQSKDNLQYQMILKTPPLTLSEVSSLCESSCTKSLDNIICKSTNNLNSNLELATWGLPDIVVEKYTSRKIKTMFSWQFECLSNSKVLNGLSNLIYSAPTSAGKTLVAEILALKTIFERKKKVIFILPFVSIVREKMYYFQDILGSSGIRVEGFMGSYNPPGGFNSINFAICTIEKANNLINRLLEEGRLSEIGSILVDEMHLLGDPHRGYILELLLTKLRYISLRDTSVQIQIIGMSATLPNLDELANWLGAELYSTSFRPIPLYEQASVCGEIYDRNLQLIRKLEPLPDIGVDTDNVLQLCLDTIKDSCSVLIFCPTKNWCENLAQQLSLAFFEIGNSQTPLGKMLRSQINSDLILEVLQQLRYCPVGLDEVLKKTISFGIAFHHAGLTIDERDIIEGAFRNGAIKILVATSTLSSGVNLPARRVLIRSPSFCGKPLNILTYRQMIGRAGRMGKDTKGESILICQKSEYKIAKELMSGELPRVESCLEEPGKLKRAILEVIASGVASSPHDITLFTNCTLLAVSNSVTENLHDPTGEAVEFLKKYEFIRLQIGGDGEKYVATSLGKACLSSSVAPDEGLTLFTELEKARQCFVLDTELHLIYLVTPYSSCHSWGNIDWMFYLDLWDKLSAAMKRVGELVGVRESYIVSATRGKIDNSSKAIHKLMIHKRFFVALALQDLVNEIPLANVCAKFNCNRGMLQSLQQSASSFAGMVTSFSRQLGWSSVEILLAQFQDRMQFGVSRDLLDLMRLPSLNGKLARTLYNAGIETIIQLANYNLDSVENILCRAGPFESCKEREGESEFDNKQRNKLRTVWVTGKEGLTEREAAQLLVQDARNYLEAEMGLKEARWKSQGSNEEVTTHKSSEHSLTHNSTKNENMVIPAHNFSVIGSSSSPSEGNVNSLIELPNASKTVTDISQENSKTQQVSIKIKSKVLSNLPSIESFSLDISNSSSIFSDISFTRLEDNIQINDNGINEARVKDIAFPDIKKSDLLIKNPPLEINISESSVFSCSENLSLNNSKVKSAADDSFSLELSNDSSDKKFNLFTQSIDEFDSQGNFEAALQKIDFSQEIKKSMENISLEYSESQKRSRESSGTTSDDSILEGTPKKKTKILDEHRTPLRNTIKMYSKMNLEDAFSEITDFSKLHIVDVCSTDALIDTFFDEIKEKMNFSFCVICTKKVINKPTIGENIFPNEKSLKTKSPKHMSYKDKIVEGFAFCWGGTESYFLSTKDLHISEKILKKLRQIFTDKQRTIKMFDAKEQIKTLKQCCDVEFCCKIDDPKVADWLLDAEGKEKSLQTLVNCYYKDLTNLGLLCGEIKAINSFDLNIRSEDNPKLRSSVEVVITWHLVNALKKKLLVKMPQFNKISFTCFLTNYDLEMQTQLCLANMELNGMSANKISLQQLADLLKNQQNALEKSAYSLAGRRFNFVSSTDVSKVIGIFGAKKSTKKQVLEQIDHPISKLVIMWRKINFTLTKMIYPLIRLCENNRIHGSYISHTATGRITMHEPNIQMVTKDFAIFDPLSKKNVLISGRSAFSVPEENILVSADYCQLELRILTYLSKDKLLTDIMRKPGDIFRSIAANWNNVAEEMVDENMRQNTKQLCYGIIYGMGPKTLGEQLGISEENALDFMESFRNTYSGIKQFIKKTVDLCKENGYVETITGRRRYLPHINNIDTSIKRQAERQAVNTTVQGSAADIVKNAMITIENQINLVFKNSRYKPKLTLHLHDELIYEVPEKYLEKTVKIIKRGMENSASIIGHFPVKIKTGKSWGQLSEYLV